MSDDLAFCTIAEYGGLLREGRATIAELLAPQRARIERLNPRYRAFSYLAGDVDPTARRLQTELDTGRDRGPLHGISVSIKGSMPVAGLPWTEGSLIFRDRTADRDAEIVAAVRRAGGVILGTTTLSELAMYAPDNPVEPLGLNPWAEERHSGGSSTGAGVAAALGMATVNIGTDAGGSIRNPACHNGVVGFMPSIDKLPRGGNQSYAPTVSTIGLIARTVDDATTAYRVLRRASGCETEAEPRPPRRRLLVLRRLIEEMCDEPTLVLFARAERSLQDAGFDMIDVDIPGWLQGERAAGVVSLAECGAALAAMELSRAGQSIRDRVARAASLDPPELERARQACACLAGNIEEHLVQYGADAIVSPCWPFAAPPILAESVVVQGKPVPVEPHRNCFVRAANAANACAITLPCGFYEAERVPAGLHLMSTAGSETALLALAALAERAMPTAARPPLD